MTTLADLRSQVYASLGNREDSDATLWADRGINAGLIAFALISEPPECRTTGSLTAWSAGTVLDLASLLTRFIRLERVYNSTGLCPVVAIPFHMWDHLWFPVLGYTQYYTLHGDKMYYKPLPTTNETLSVWYFQYPERLDAADDVYPFRGGEDFVLAFAKKWAWACQEETDASNLWSGLAAELLLPEKTISDLRRLTREEWGHELNVQGAVSKGSSEA